MIRKHRSGTTPAVGNMASIRWAKRGRPQISCSHCGHLERDYRTKAGACVDVAACEDRIRRSRAVRIAPPVDYVSIHEYGVDIVRGRFQFAGVLYEFERIA